MEVGSFPFYYLIFNEVLEYLRYDPLYALYQLNRVLINDGWLLLTTPNLYVIQQKVGWFLLGNGFGDSVNEFAKLRNGGHMGHIRAYFHKEVKKILDAANFIVNRVWHKHYHYPITIRSYQVVLAQKAGNYVALYPI